MPVDSDGGVFANSAFGQAIENCTLHIPKPSPLPGTTSQNYPYVIVGDEAFPGRYLSGIKPRVSSIT